MDALARGLKNSGDTRTLAQLRADVFCDLLAGTLVIESQTTLWVVDGVKQLLTWMGAPGIGAATAIGAALISLSVWTLYQNLFRHSTRGGSHATT